MTKELVISANRHETKLAVLEDDQLVEVYFQRSNEYSLVSSIHKGKVTRVLPGMQSAFVELGLERDAFLYVSDFFEESGEDYERISTGDDRGRRDRDRGGRHERPERGDRNDRQAVERTESAERQPSRTPVEAAQVPPAQAGLARDDRDQGRRRRGRRRRGGRGGFPEAKYASPVAESTVREPDASESTASESIDALEPAGATSGTETFLLPGESIAKYRRPPSELENDESEPEAGEQEISIPEASAPESESEEGSLPLIAEPPPLPRRAEADQEPSRGEPEEEPMEGANLLDELQQEVEALMAANRSEEAHRLATDALAEPDGSEQSIEEENGGEVEEEPISAEALDAEPSTIEAAMEAEVREQPTARYIQRGPRRIRRRGRPERGERSGGGERYESVPRGEGQVVTRPDRDKEKSALPSISDLLKEGQEIIVQIAKEPLGQKGARITSHIAMPGRYVVYMPTSDHHGVSRKVGSDEERHRLKRIVQTHSMGMTGGFIVRTAGEGKSEADIAADMNYLYNQWLDIRKKAEKRNAPCLLHHDLELVTRTLRDQASDQFKAVWVDNEEVYENIVAFLERFQPALVNRVKLYTRDEPIFDTFNVTSELEKALRPKVWLKSGGYIVINQTEALVAIDINTGKFVGKSNRLEDTIVKTNLEAIKEIVRQVRLRDLGGIIVVDFIDMEERKNRQKVMQGLEEAMRLDRAPYKILSFNDFGLVAITRRRVKQSLERALCEPCPTCEGAGYVKSVQTVVGEIITEAFKLAPSLESQDVMLRVHPEVAKAIKAADQNFLAELEDILKKNVIVKSDPLLHPEKFDLA